MTKKIHMRLTKTGDRSPKVACGDHPSSYELEVGKGRGGKLVSQDWGAVTCRECLKKLAGFKDMQMVIGHEKTSKYYKDKGWPEWAIGESPVPRRRRVISQRQPSITPKRPRLRR